MESARLSVAHPAAVGRPIAAFENSGAPALANSGRSSVRVQEDERRRSMNVTEVQSDGLKRELAVVVPAADLVGKLDTYLQDMSGKVRINGFRPGKVPIAHLKRLYGRSAMADIVNDLVTETVKNAVGERGERPALQPAVDVADGVMEAVLEGEGDLAFSLRYEVLPEIPAADAKAVKIEQPVAPVTDADVDADIERFAGQIRNFADKGEAAAADGDKVTIDFVGKIDGEPFENGSAEDADLVIGSGQFIPGFEEQLVGAKAGDERLVEVTFPAEYPAEQLAGKAATFDVKVKAVAAPEETKFDDAFAERLGMKTFDELKAAVREQVEKRHAAASRQKAKRALLDALDKQNVFEVPQGLVDSEFEAIWRQLTGDMARSGRSFTDEETTEDAAKEEYRKIAERRVRLGLLLSEIGEKASIDVTDEEVQGALRDKIRQFPGQEREVFEYYKKTPAAVAALKGPLFEDKVVDYLLELATVDRKTVTKEELFADDEEATTAA